VSVAREKIQIRQAPAEDSVLQMSTLRQSLCQSSGNSSFGMTEPNSFGSEKITAQHDGGSGKQGDGDLDSEAGSCSSSVSSSVTASDHSQDTSSHQTFGVESHVARDMAAEIHVLLDQLENDVRSSYDELNASVSEDANNVLGFILQGFFFTHLWDDILTFYRYKPYTVSQKIHHRDWLSKYFH